MSDFVASNGYRVYAAAGGLVIRSAGNGLRHSLGTYSVAALREYFEAHPKPWHDAKEGEVWVITVDGNQYPTIFQADMFRDTGGGWPAESISDARRIWPEES